VVALKDCRIALVCGQISPPGEEERVFLTALPCQDRREHKGATYFHGENSSLSYLQMTATGRIKKGPQSAQKPCRKSPAERGGSRS